MPLALKPKEIKTEFDGNKSVLIVACNVCPKMCLAAEQRKPYFSLLGRSKDNPLKTYLQGIRSLLAHKGISSALFKAPIDTPMCLWPLKSRRKLAEYARNYDAVAVVGCDSATATAKDSIASPDKNVIQMMDVAGIANFISRISFPFNIYLEAATEKEISMPGKI
jgi:hypothetical protein